MKRSEIEVGADYVVYSNNTTNPRYSGRRARVLDTEPVWVKKSGWSRSEEATSVKVPGFDGKVVEATDHTKKMLYDHDKASARTGVKVLMQHEYGDHGYIVTIKNISHVQKPWADHEASIVEDAKAEKAQMKRERQAEKEKNETAARLNRMLTEFNGDATKVEIDAKVVNKPYRPFDPVFVKVTAESFENLLDRLREAESMFVDEEA